MCKCRKKNKFAVWTLDGRGGCGGCACAQVSEHVKWSTMACWQTYPPPSEAWKRQLLRDDPKLHWLDSSVNQLNDGKTGGAWGFRISPVWGGKSTCKVFNGVCRICRIWLWKGCSQWCSARIRPCWCQVCTAPWAVKLAQILCPRVLFLVIRSGMTVLGQYFVATSGWLWYGLQLRW